MIHTDNTETLKNALAKIEELEHENTMLIGEAEELKADLAMIGVKYQETLMKLRTAIEALESYAELYPTPDEIAVEALNKLRSE